MLRHLMSDAHERTTKFPTVPYPPSIDTTAKRTGLSGHPRSVRVGAVLGQGCVAARCWAMTGPHGPDSAESRAVLGHGC